VKNEGFGKVSEDYGRNAVVQAAASVKLADWLALKSGEEVLDLGCGSGEITARLARETGAAFRGCDVSEGMIARAKERFPAIEFTVSGAEDLPWNDEFDAIFCNSTFQWFKDPQRALSRCREALKRGGRIGVQAPGGRDFCPVFMEAVSRLASDARTAPTWAGFRSPWFFLPGAEDYRRLFSEAGFRVEKAELETTASVHTLRELCGIFGTGAGVGYLDPSSYASVPPAGYAEAALGIIERSFAERARPDVELRFTRIYLVAIKD
jgi:trans-aconitate methyltransferase